MTIFRIAIALVLSGCLLPAGVMAEDAKASASAQASVTIPDTLDFGTYSDKISKLPADKKQVFDQAYTTDTTKKTITRKDGVSNDIKNQIPAILDSIGYKNSDSSKDSKDSSSSSSSKPKGFMQRLRVGIMANLGMSGTQSSDFAGIKSLGGSQTGWLGVGGGIEAELHLTNIPMGKNELRLAVGLGVKYLLDGANYLTQIGTVPVNFREQYSWIDIPIVAIAKLMKFRADVGVSFDFAVGRKNINDQLLGIVSYDPAKQAQDYSLKYRPFNFSTVLRFGYELELKLGKMALTLFPNIEYTQDLLNLARLNPYNPSIIPAPQLTNNPQIVGSPQTRMWNVVGSIMAMYQF